MAAAAAGVKWKSAMFSVVTVAWDSKPAPSPPIYLERCPKNSGHGMGMPFC